MKHFKFITIIVTACLVLTTSCSDSFWNCIDGNGRTTTVRRVVGNFSNVTSYGSFIVDITIGSPTSVSVEADENLLSYIETYIQGNTLVLETKNGKCINSRDRIYVHVVTPDLYQLKLSGSGAVYCDNIVADELKYILSGSGNIESSGINTGFMDASISGSGEIILSGVSTQSNFLISGSGNIKSLDLAQEKCIATISGSGNIYASVSDLLDVLISGSGNVIYSGTPAIESNITGSGRIIKY
ncbi:MAG: DUF2807 domain-containing protein [Bacteroidales bacterium]|nr:DUF2807 domain-containing protein [Bacteroidales bacterium]MCB8999281.1 DUF2807 domain-containing protein [Bacteroidales bacterium]MCB9013049.1 DUF2807 domain-containing protein [Bacteroidales bacterium]